MSLCNLWHKIVHSWKLGHFVWHLHVINLEIVIKLNGLTVGKRLHANILQPYLVLYVALSLFQPPLCLCV